MPSLEGILFDNDGTLVDTHDLIMESFFYATERVLGHSVTEAEVRATGGQPLDVQMRIFAHDDALAAELSRVYREYNHAIHDERIRLFEGVLNGLDTLHAAGFKMGVVTSKKHWLTWHGLEITGCAPYMGCCIGADDCESHKPDPAPLLMGAEQLGIDASRCIYLGDSPYDVQAANAAGCTSVAALWGMFDTHEITAAAPEYSCADFAEFTELALRLQKERGRV